jgi:hypothetical protein
MLLREGLKWPLDAKLCNLGAGVGGPANLVTGQLTVGAAALGGARKLARELVDAAAKAPARRPCGREWCGDARGW